MRRHEYVYVRARVRVVHSIHAHSHYVRLHYPALSSPPFFPVIASVFVRARKRDIIGEWERANLVVLARFFYIIIIVTVFA